jgi:hypothetical protein
VGNLSVRENGRHQSRVLSIVSSPSTYSFKKVLRHFHPASAGSKRRNICIFFAPFATCPELVEGASVQTDFWISVNQ